MGMDYRTLVETSTLTELIDRFPVTEDFLLNLNLEGLPREVCIPVALQQASEERLADFGCSRADVILQLARFLDTMLDVGGLAEPVHSLTILGGRDKHGTHEAAELTIRSGEIISIVGPTGSGKSRLLADIECMAQGDTPTGRRILLNHKPLSDDERFAMEGRLVAQLSQNMNFVVDLSVAEFLEMHAISRMSGNTEATVERCFHCANELAGEKFTPETKVTQLSGGQSRALMIADTAYMSTSPVVLIDEIENAGIDRKKSLDLLAGADKIVLISTHDPLLALSAKKRIVIRNGGISKIVETRAEELESLAIIENLDQRLMAVRGRLRLGERIMPQELAGEEDFHVGAV